MTESTIPQVVSLLSTSNAEVMAIGNTSNNAYIRMYDAQHLGGANTTRSYLFGITNSAITLTKDSGRTYVGIGTTVVATGHANTNILHLHDTTLIANRISTLDAGCNITFNTKNILGISNLDFSGALTSNGIPYLPTKWTSATQGSDNKPLIYHLGNVAIGSNQIQGNAKLHVAGNLNFTGSLLSNNTPYQWQYNKEDIYFRCNVAIGSDTPLAPLDVTRDARIGNTWFSDVARERNIMSRADVTCNLSSGWTRPAEFAATTPNFTGICWAPEKRMFVGVGTPATWFVSTNGITWSSGSMASIANTVCWVPAYNKFVALSDTNIFVSPNGTSWTQSANLFASATFHASIWVEELNIFVAVGLNKIMYIEGDPQIAGPVILNTDPLGTWKSVCWSPQLKLFVAVADSAGPLLTSKDGKSWNRPVASVTLKAWQSICWSARLSMFVAVASDTSDSMWMYSYDGTKWDTKSDANVSELQCITWSSDMGIFVAAGKNKLLYSFDGLSWTNISSAIPSAQTSDMWSDVIWSHELSVFLLTRSNSTNTGRVIVSSPAMSSGSLNTLLYGPGQVTTQYATGNLGVGTTIPLARTHIHSSISTTSDIFEVTRLVSNKLTPSIVVNGNGCVGIGTTSPTKPLHVYDDAYFQGNVGIGTNAKPPQDGLIVKGSVGIGTTNPNAPLHVQGRMHTSIGITVGMGYSNFTAPENGMILQGAVGIGTTGSYVESAGISSALTVYGGNVSFRTMQSSNAEGMLYIGRRDAQESHVIATKIGGEGASNYIQWRVCSNASLSRTALTIQGDGNVGIGSTQPAYPLDLGVTGIIRASTYVGQLQFSLNTGTGMKFDVANTTFNNTSSRTISLDDTTVLSAEPIETFVKTYGTDYEIPRITVNRQGRITAATTVNMPKFLLKTGDNVSGDISFDSNISIVFNRDVNTPRSSITYDGMSTPEVLRFRTSMASSGATASWTDVMTFDITNQRVGIKKINPSEALDVTGIVKANAFLGTVHVSNISGTLATSNGGTNQTIWTKNAIVYANETNQLSNITAITWASNTSTLSVIGTVSVTSNISGGNISVGSNSVLSMSSNSSLLFSKAGGIPRTSMFYEDGANGNPDVFKFRTTTATSAASPSWNETLTFDITNQRVGIKKTNPSEALDVTGIVKANAFLGTVHVSNIQGTLATSNGGTNQTIWTKNAIVYANETNQLSNITAITWASNTTTLSVIGTVSATSFTGNVSGGNISVGSNSVLSVGSNSVISMGSNSVISMGSNSSILFSNAGGIPRTSMFYENGVNGNPDVFKFRTTTATSAASPVWNETLTFDITSNRVGIKKTNPSEALDVNGNIACGTSNVVTIVNTHIGEIAFLNGVNKLAGVRSAVNVGGSSNNADLRFCTSCNENSRYVERMRIDRDGYVGIGTTAPLSTLHVEGDINFTGKLYGKTSEYAASQWTSVVGNRIQYSSGNVGIGTTAPLAPLHVHDRIHTATGITVGLGFSNATTPENGMILQGRVGIGTTAPLAPLHVTDRIHTATGITVGLGFSNATAPTNGMILQGRVGIGTNAPLAALHVNDRIHTATGITVGSGYSNATAPENGMILQGGVGIGTTGPYVEGEGLISALTVYGGNVSFRTMQSSNAEGMLYIGRRDTTASHAIVSKIGGSGTSNYVQFQLFNTATDVSNKVLTILGNGNVGIGSTLPAFHLDMGSNGIIRANTYEGKLKFSVGVGTGLKFDPSTGANTFDNTSNRTIYLDETGVISTSEPTKQYGSESKIPQITVNRQGRITAVNEKDIDVTKYLEKTGGNVSGNISFDSNTSIVFFKAANTPRSSIRYEDGPPEVLKFRTTTAASGTNPSWTDTLTLDITNGRVGIKKNNPSEALEVDGTVKATTLSATTLKGEGGNISGLNADNISGTLAVSKGGTGKQNWTQNAFLYASTTDTLSSITNVTWAANNTALSVNGNIASGTSSVVTSADTHIGEIAFFNGTNKVTGVRSTANIGGVTNTADLRFCTTSNEASRNEERMRINRDGNVGIGTTSPLRRLHVEGDINFTGKFFQNNAEYIGSQWTTGTNNIIYYASGNVGVGTTIPLALTHILHTGTGDIFRVDDTNVPDTTPFIIKEDGNIGIGTTNPQAAFHVNTNRDSSSVLVQSSGTASTAPTVQIRKNLGSSDISGNQHRFQLEISKSTDNKALALGVLDNGLGVIQAKELNNGSYLHLLLNPLPNDMTNARVGIGTTTTPESKLYVYGTITAQDDVVAKSDERMKMNISIIQNSLEKVKQVSGYTFEKLDAPGIRRAGVIAQEIEKILPEVVHTIENGYKSVAYGNIVALLIEAIKELNAKVDAQTQMIHLLKEQCECITKQNV